MTVGKRFLSTYVGVIVCFARSMIQAMFLRWINDTSDVSAMAESVRPVAIVIIQMQHDNVRLIYPINRTHEPDSQLMVIRRRINALLTAYQVTMHNNFHLQRLL